MPRSQDLVIFMLDDDRQTNQLLLHICAQGKKEKRIIILMDCMIWEAQNNVYVIKSSYQTLRTNYFCACV